MTSLESLAKQVNSLSKIRLDLGQNWGGHNLPALGKQGGLPWIPFCIQGGLP